MRNHARCDAPEDPAPEKEVTMSGFPHNEERGVELVRDAIARAVAVVGLVGVALIHVLDAHDTFVSTPYKGWLYLALIVSCLATAALLLRHDDRRVWLAALLLPLGALSAFIYSRTFGLPGGADDIGNWWEPLGLASMFVEAVLAGLAGAMLARTAPRRSTATRMAFTDDSQETLAA